MCIRPNIAYVIGIISQFLLDLGKKHQNAMKWILTHLHGIVDIKLYFGGDKPNLTQI